MAADLYATLGVARDADAATIKRAYPPPRPMAAAELVRFLEERFVAAAREGLGGQTGCHRLATRQFLATRLLRLGCTSLLSMTIILKSNRCQSQNIALPADL